MPFKNKFVSSYDSESVYLKHVFWNTHLYWKVNIAPCLFFGTVKNMEIKWGD